MASVVLGVVSAGCATLTTSAHVEPGISMAQYHSFAWAPADALPTSDPRLDNAFVRDHLQGATEKALAARGLQVQSDTASADVLVHFHGNMSPAINPVSGDSSTGSCYDENCVVRVLQHEVGLIVIDVVDARTQKLIWRGWASNGFEDALNDPDRLQRRVTAAVNRMFTQFPR